MRIQLCGHLAVEREGRRIDNELPGRKGRVLFAYLVANRDRVVARDQLVEALWSDATPSAVDGDLRALLSKIRRAIGCEAVGLRGRYRLDLPPDTWVDVEAATSALHLGESAVTAGDWPRAWSQSLIAMLAARRGFLVGEEASWIDEKRRYVAQVGVRALECYTAACLAIGGPELRAAERSARLLIEEEPYRESGYRFLMEVLAAGGNVGEAIQVYDRLRCLFRDELGIGPSPLTQELHRRLLRGDEAPAQ
jgi:DNA-binding SARP family transcriptional activator